MKTILPTTDRVVILPKKEKEKTSGIKIVRDHRNIEMQFGTVIAAGPESPIKEGVDVLFIPSSGTILRRLQDNGRWQELRIMHSDSLQAVLSDV